MRQATLLAALVGLLAPAAIAQPVTFDPEVVWEATVPRLHTVTASPEGDRIVTTNGRISFGPNSAIRVWDPATGALTLEIVSGEQANFPTPGPVRFASDGQGYVSAHGSSYCNVFGCGSVGSWRQFLDDGTPTLFVDQVIRITDLDHRGPYVALGRFITSQTSSNFRVYSYPEAELIHFEIGPYPKFVRFTHDMEHLLIVDRDDRVSVRSVPSWDEVHAFTPGGEIGAITFSEDGSRLAVSVIRGLGGATPARFLVYDRATWSLQHAVNAPDMGSVLVWDGQATFSPGNNYLLARMGATIQGDITRKQLLQLFDLDAEERVASQDLGTHGYNDRGSTGITRVPGTHDYAYLVQDTLRVVHYPTRTGTVSAGEPVATAEPLRVTLHPNPVRQRAALTVAGATGAVRIEVFDALGRLVHRHDAGEGAAAREVALDASRWPAGVYVVRVGDDLGWAHRRITVVR